MVVSGRNVETFPLEIHSLFMKKAGDIHRKSTGLLWVVHGISTNYPQDIHKLSVLLRRLIPWLSTGYHLTIHRVAHKGFTAYSQCYRQTCPQTPPCGSAPISSSYVSRKRTTQDPSPRHLPLCPANAHGPPKKKGRHQASCMWPANCTNRGANRPATSPWRLPPTSLSIPRTPPSARVPV